VPAHGDRKLQQALRDLVSALGATRVPWMIIGGIAVIARGVRRFTGDIDAAVRGDEIDAATLLDALAKKRIVPRIARAEQFARESLVLLLRHEPSGVQFDVSFAWTDFEREAISAASIASFGAVKAPMAQPEDLIVFKAIAGRGKDLDDATALLSLYPQLDLARLRARVHQLAALAETPDLGAGLETAIAAAAEARPAPPGAIRAQRITPTPRTRATPKRTTPKPRRKHNRK
jgi:hypothetical protein